MGRKSNQKKDRKNTMEVVTHVMTNNPHEGQHLCMLFEMLHRACFSNLLGIMQAVNSDTGQEEILVVGLEPTADNKFNSYPLARILNKDEANKYLAPDGRGGWGGKPSDVQAAA